MSESVEEEVLAPSESPAPADTSEDSAPHETDAPAVDESGEQPADAPEAKPEPKQRRGIEKRFHEYATQLREANEQIDKLRAEESARRAAAEVGEPPKQEDFDTFEAYLSAQTQHAVKSALSAREAETLQAQAKREEQQAAMALEAKWAATEEAARAKYSDYVEVAYNDHIPISAQLADVIKASPDGAEVAYYLGTHPTEAAEMAAMPSPVSQALAVGAIAGRLRSGPVVAQPRSNAPKPAGTGRTASDTSAPRGLSDKADLKTWMQARNKQVRG